MRTLVAIFTLTGLLSCTDRHTKQSNTQKQVVSNKGKSFVTAAIDAKLPLRLDEINLDGKNNTVILDNKMILKIEGVVKAYAKDLEFNDSSQAYKDTYINTIRLQDSLQSLFLVLLKNYPTNEVNGRVLFYDNQKKEFAEDEFEFKLYALYDYEMPQLKASNLKTLFNIRTPEIELTGFNKDGINDYKFVRLWHNGTFNAVHTTILTVSNNETDTLFFDERPMEYEELPQGRKSKER